MLILIQAIREPELPGGLRQKAQLTQSTRVSRGGSNILPNGSGLAPWDGTRNNERLYRTAETRDYHDNRNHWRRQVSVRPLRNGSPAQESRLQSATITDRDLCPRLCKALAVGSGP